MDIIIRAIEHRDAQALSKIRRMPGVIENTLGLPSERETDTEAFIQNIGKNQHQFVAALTDGSDRAVGTAALMVQDQPRMRHSAVAAILIHPDYQGQGVGTRLMQAILDVADNYLMLVRVELCVYSNNERAIRLYEKMGFQKEGVKRKAVIQNGAYIDEIMMARIRE